MKHETLCLQHTEITESTAQENIYQNYLHVKSNGTFLHTNNFHTLLFMKCRFPHHQNIFQIQFPTQIFPADWAQQTTSRWHHQGTGCWRLLCMQKLPEHRWNTTCIPTQAQLSTDDTTRSFASLHFLSYPKQYGKSRKSEVTELHFQHGPLNFSMGPQGPSDGSHPV